MTEQPVWQAIANLGDVNPLDHGGAYVLIDQTGVYPPEVEFIEVPDEEPFEYNPYTVYRFPLENFTLTDGILSDNPYHPKYPVWFADSINDMVGPEDAQELVDGFLSDNPIAKAQSYLTVLYYYGPVEFDQYPLTFSRAELEARLSQDKYQLT